MASSMHDRHNNKRHPTRSPQMDDPADAPPSKRKRILSQKSSERQRHDTGGSKWSRRTIPPPMDLYSFQLPDRQSPHPPRPKTKDGHFGFHNGDNIGSRYKILCQLGEGTFGRVLECWDRKTKTIVAIKVVRSVPKYRDAAMIEAQDPGHLGLDGIVCINLQLCFANHLPERYGRLEVLNAITASDPRKAHCVIHLQAWFEYRDHICIVFERLGASLYDFMRKNGHRGFPLDVVQHISRQMLSAIAYMHSLSIVHTDLKPENILFVNSNEYAKLDRERCGHLGCRVPLNPDVKIIDFGSATFEHDRHSSLVSTRHYRAPEVILGLGWSYACDIWSAGCIIVELITGRALFLTHENKEHLAMMERVINSMPTDMVKKASPDVRRLYSSSSRTLLWPDNASKKSQKSVGQLMKLWQLLRSEGDASIYPHLHELHNLLSQMLTMRPASRATARACMDHPFFRERVRSLLPARSSPEDGDSRPGSESALVPHARQSQGPIDVERRALHRKTDADERLAEAHLAPVVVVEERSGKAEVGHCGSDAPRSTDEAHTTTAAGIVDDVDDRDEGAGEVSGEGKFASSNGAYAPSLRQGSREKAKHSDRERRAGGRQDGQASDQAENILWSSHRRSQSGEL